MQHSLPYPTTVVIPICMYGISTILVYLRGRLNLSTWGPTRPGRRSRHSRAPVEMEDDRHGEHTSSSGTSFARRASHFTNKTSEVDSESRRQDQTASREANDTILFYDRDKPYYECVGQSLYQGPHRRHRLTKVSS